MNRPVKFTLVSTVFNESTRLAVSINDIEGQTLLPNEIVIVDAGSTDGTFERLQQWAQTSSISIHILQEKDCNVAWGRNLAIEHSSCDLIVSTDFGCRFKKEWLSSIIKPFEDDNVRVVGGAYGVDEKEIRTLSAKANYVLTNGYAINLDHNFIPSSRSIAYYKEVWRKSGKYDEWLTLAADDLVFGLKVKANKYNIHLVTETNVLWGRHPKFWSYLKESNRYGLGDGEAQVNKKNIISNVVETLMRYFLFAGIPIVLISVIYFNKPVWLFVVLILGVGGLRSYKNAFSNWLKFRSHKYTIKVMLFSLVMIEFLRWNYIKGYLKGYFFSKAEVRRGAHKLSAILK